MKNSTREFLIVSGLILVKLCIHFATNTNYELHRDGLLYYSLGENLDWGFMSVPPFIAFISKLSTIIFGNTTFALRFFPAIIGGLSIFIIAKIIKELNGSLFAIIIGSLAFILSPAFLRSNTLFQPVSFNQFFWLLSGYLILRLIKTQDARKWIPIFIVWGIAFLNKYSITFFIISSLLGLLFTPFRRLFLSRYFIIGGLIGIIIILPNLFWQYHHGFPLIHHMAELQKNQFVNVTMVGFLIDQIMMNLPALVIWMTGLIAVLVLRSERQYRVFGYLYLIMLFTLVILRGKSYYTLGLYPTLFAFGAYAIDKYYKTYLKYLVVVLVFLLSIPMLPFSLPVYSHEKIAEFSKNTAEFTNRWEDGEIYDVPQDYADMTGWSELAEIVINHYNSLPEEEKNRCKIYADNYGQAGAIKFYGKKHELPDPICFNDNFLLWAPDSIENVPLIFVSDELGNVT